MTISRYMMAVAVLTAAAFLLVGCKPTEKNYREAYDVAMAKRQAETIDADLGIDFAAMQDRDAPRMAVFSNGDTVLVKHENVKPVDEGVELKRNLVAVAKFKMLTNAASLAKMLRTHRHDNAVVVKNRDNSYYVIAEQCDSVEQAARFSRIYMEKNPEVRYIGLPDQPVVIISR